MLFFDDPKLTNFIQNQYHDFILSRTLDSPQSRYFKFTFTLSLNICSQRVLSSCMGSLKLIILIFSSINRLHLLKLYAVEDVYIPLIWGFRPWSLRFQKYFDRPVWFLSRELGEEFKWLYSPYFQFRAEIPMYIFSQSYLCSLGEMHDGYTMFS